MDTLIAYESSDDEDGRSEQSATVGKITLCPDKTIFQRTVPHTDGLYASHIFIRCHLSSNLTSVLERLESSGYSGKCWIHPETHLSLTREFALTKHHIESFERQIRTAVRRIAKFNVLIEDTFVILHNDAGTRSFVGRPVTASRSLLDLIHACDSILVQYDLPCYYQPPQCHVSTASLTPALLQKAVDVFDCCQDDPVVCTVDCMTLKMGTHDIVNIPLGDQ